MAAMNEIYITIGGSKVPVLNITSFNDTTSVQVLGTPIENGAIKFDHRVRAPITVTVAGQVDKALCGMLKSSVRKSVDAKNMDNAFCTVYPPDGDSIERMVITNFSQSSKTDSLNLVDVNISLQEIMKA